MTANRMYNERLFSGGPRKFVHELRFKWLKQASQGLSGSVFELGCYDARSLDYLAFAPARYLGVDAGWEGGLKLARARFPQHEFRCERSPTDPLEQFDVAICLETLEHLPRSEMGEYLDILCKTAPVLLCSVPVEIGPVFLGRYLAKSVLGRTEAYSAADVFNLVFNRAARVGQDNHKGFDYRLVIRELRRRYREVSVVGMPLAFAPYLSLNVGIIARR